MKCQSSLDHDAATAAMRAQWDQTARGWSDSGAVIRPWLHQATQAMLGMAGVKSASHVLDVAAGAGDQTLDIAERVGPEGYVLATDLSPEILQFAAQQITAAGHRHVETRVSDGQQLQIEDSRFDAVVCRLGLMFFGDPLQGVREMARVLKPGGVAVVSVYYRNLILRSRLLTRLAGFALGRWVSLSWEGGRVAGASSSDGREVTYAYDEAATKGEQKTFEAKLDAVKDAFTSRMYAARSTADMSPRSSTSLPTITSVTTSGKRRASATAVSTCTRSLARSGLSHRPSITLMPRRCAMAGTWSTPCSIE